MIYRIREWDRHFENASSRKLKRLDWVALPNKMDGEGYTALVDHPNGAAHFGAWVAIVEIASKQNPRGTLPVGGICQDVGRICQSLGRISRLPPIVFEQTLPRLIEIGWIEEVPCIQQSATTLGESADVVGESANALAEDGATRNYRELQGREGNGNGTPPPSTDSSIPLDRWAERLYARHPKKKNMVLVQGALWHVLEKAKDRRALLAEIDRVHALWCAYPPWQEKSGGFVPPLADWLEDQGWTQEPRPDKSPLERIMDSI